MILIAVILAFCVAFAHPATAATETVTVGNAKVVVKTVTGGFEGEMRELKLLDDVYHNEVVETAKESATQLQFLDNTTVTMGPDSRIIVDRFVYDPDPSKSAFVMTAVQGVFRFASGKLPKDAYQIHTPAATIGIRGTVLRIAVEREGANAVAVEVVVDSGEADILTREGTHVHLSHDQPAVRIVSEGVTSP